VAWRSAKNAPDSSRDAGSAFRTGLLRESTRGHSLIARDPVLVFLVKKSLIGAFLYEFGIAADI
jgi:hypothetical protein